MMRTPASPDESTVRCPNCGMLMSAHLMPDHECQLGTVMLASGEKLSLRFHDDSRDWWPYYSKGYRDVTPAKLAAYVKGLNPELRRQFMEALTVEPAKGSGPHEDCHPPSV